MDELRVKQLREIDQRLEAVMARIEPWTPLNCTIWPLLRELREDLARMIREADRTISLEIAARVWCDQEMKNVVMDVSAAEAIARIIDGVRKTNTQRTGGSGV